MHAVLAGQATARGEMSCPPGSSGVGWIRHLIPFHRSAMVAGADGEKMSPVAVHAEGDVHETLLKKSPCPFVPGGTGVA
jgi:hypothetical protein